MKAPQFSLMLLISLLPLMSPKAQLNDAGQFSARRQDHSGMILIPAGELRPFVLSPGQPQRKRIAPFFLDQHAVTNAAFAEFVRANPEWRRSRVPRIFADNNYLKHWTGDLEVGNAKLDNSPVTNVSWFAAEAYCRWKGKRLPSLDEWEYAAGVLPINAKPGENLSRIILGWYDHPTPTSLPAVESTYRNKFGLWDMHGLIWEWVADFNSVTLQGQHFYCGGGSAGTANKEDYAAYMRYAFRESLQAAYTVGSLGFRCAEDTK